MIFFGTSLIFMPSRPMASTTPYSPGFYVNDRISVCAIVLATRLAARSAPPIAWTLAASCSPLRCCGRSFSENGQPMINLDLVHLSRLQFALTALLSLPVRAPDHRLSIAVADHGIVYVMTGREIMEAHDPLLGLLFASILRWRATGITMEFQFARTGLITRTTWEISSARRSRSKACWPSFLESTFVGLFFFGWDRLSKVGHLIVTGLVALGSNLSAVWILIANG